MRYRSMVLSVVLLATMLSATGCMTMEYVVPSEQQRSNYETLGSFEVKKRASWVVFGLVPIQAPAVEDLVRREVERLDGTAATNVVITSQFDAADVIVSAVVGGLFNTRSYTVKGDVVRLRGGTASLPAGDEQVILGEVRYE